jgi:hypothetical protein
MPRKEESTPEFPARKLSGNGFLARADFMKKKGFL